jgi:MHS family proline/betaine transporter-like MFS transporter
LFPTRTRQTGLSVAYSITAAIFAGTVPYVLTWLIAQTGNQMMPAFYLILVGLIGLAAVLSMKESKGRDLMSDEDIKASRQALDTAGAPTVRN